MMTGLSLFLSAISLISLSERPLDIHPTQKAEIQKLFAEPPAVFASGPLWVWNDRITDEEVVSTLRDLCSQGVRQAFIHPRPGLMTPYLSDEWFHLYDTALKEAQKLGMHLWIYDENSYPSGFAGGFVPDAMPESVGKGLQFKRVKSLDPKSLPEKTVALFELTKGEGETLKAVPCTDKVRKAETALSGDFAVFDVRFSGTASWYGGKTYVNLLDAGVTEKFLQLTLDPYKKHFGDRFGTWLLGSFTDEPNIHPTGGGDSAPWTNDLDQRFQKRWGYSLKDHLPSLFLPVGDWKRIRHNYYQLLNEEYINHWAKPYSEYCEKNNLALTGHYWDHDWPIMVGVPDNMAMYQWHQVPAIDCLMNQYREDTHAQFGNARMVKELASVANQMGYHRRLCEAYGAGGWDLRFEDMKRIGDWLYVLGVNLLDQHLSYMTLRGARKRDHPQSFSYHEPWWEAYHISADYFARLSVPLSSGEQINPILVIEPTTSAWMLLTPSADNPNLKQLGDRFQSLLTTLEAEQVEYDIGCEDILTRHGSTVPEGLKVGKRVYSTVILPEDCENLNESTLKLLSEFSGALISLRTDLPSRIDGKESDAAKALSSCKEGILKTDPKALIALLRKRHTEMPQFSRSTEQPGKLFHQRRVCDDGQILFLVNTSLEGSAQAEVTMAGTSVETWNLNTGKPEPYPFKTEGGKVRLALDIPPAGSALFFVSKTKGTPAESKKGKRVGIPASGAPSILRADPNVLPLDYCSVTAGGESLNDAHFFQAQTFVFQKNGFPIDPWDNAVQFKDELITKTFPASSGFTATFKFQIKDKVPASLWAVVERPDLYKITVNDKPVQASPGLWYLDHAFGRIDIHSAAVVGQNTLALIASPMTMYHELETIYLVGDFRLQPENSGFSLIAEQPLKLGMWSEQGNPFYSSKMLYRESFNLDTVSGRYIVAFPKWYGSVAKVSVNGEEAGFVGWQPWETDVTRWMKPGANTIEIAVYGTLKNTLGPHHNHPPLGTAWPGMFKQAPKSGPPEGKEYDVVGYGLFEPFTLLQVF